MRYLAFPLVSQDRGKQAVETQGSFSTCSPNSELFERTIALVRKNTEAFAAAQNECNANVAASALYGTATVMRVISMRNFLRTKVIAWRIGWRPEMEAKIGEIISYVALFIPQDMLFRALLVRGFVFLCLAWWS